MTGDQRYTTEKVDVSLLAKPIEFATSGLKAKNVFLKAAMTERLSAWDQKDETKRGTPSDTLVKVYEEWGKGGFGVILSGNTLVDPINLEAPGNIIFSKSVADPNHEAQVKKLVQGAKAEGSLFVFQLSHGGRQVVEALQPDPVSASDIKLDDRMGMSFGKPHPATTEEIKTIINNFAEAAAFAKKVGADGVQLHAAHGYLLAQFLSGTTNKRTDNYGGSIENRARIIFEIIEAIQAKVNDKKFSISLKLNSVEFQEGGLQPDEAASVVGHLAKLGVDWIELSGGTYEELAFQHKRESTKVRESYFLEFADIIRPKAGEIKLYVTGGFRKASSMVQAIKDGSTDGIGLARPVTEEFDLPKKIIEGKVFSARKSLVDASDFGTGNVLAGTQIQQVGSGVQAIDSSDEHQMAKFQARVGEYFQESGENAKQGIIKAGYPTLSSTY